MAEPLINRFVKGLNSDLSLTDRPQDVYLDGHNIRLARRDEGSLWAANIKGNEETFELSNGFIPIGSKEFDGFLFIMSVNPNNSECEIGSFPAPTPTGIQRIYKPLNNYSVNDIILDIEGNCLLPEINGLGIFRTTKLNFRCDKPIRMIIRLDFDGSVNLYWTDDNMPWRVINNGFVLSTGLPNNRYVTQSQITTGFINGINESEKIPNVEMISQSTGGQLKIGQYFFFIRYTDLNFLSTSYLGQSGPIPVFNTSTLGVDVTSGGEAVDVTDVSVNLIISNLDVTIDFFEVAYVRYFGNDLYESYLIDKRFAIAGLSSKAITISGFEPLVALTIDDIIVQKPSDALYCKDLNQLNNVMYLANTRGPQLDHPDLRKFICALELSENYTNNGPSPEVRIDININQYTVDPNNTEDRVGYFSGETYVFGVVPVFRGGYSGFPYPLKGFDNYNGLMTSPNQNGVYRFKKAHIAPFWDGTDTYIKSVVVNVTPAAIAIYNGSQWLKDNLIGVNVVRGERNENLLYQGLSLRCYNGSMSPKLVRWGANSVPTCSDPRNIRLRGYELYGYTGGGRWDCLLPTGPAYVNFEDWHTTKTFPLFEPATYNMIAFTESLDPNQIYVQSRYFCYAHPIFHDERNDMHDKTALAVFSTDYYIDRKEIPAGTHIQLVAKTDYYNDWRRECTAFNPVPINNLNAICSFRRTPTDQYPNSEFDVTCKTTIPVSNRGAAQTFVGYNLQGLTYSIDKFDADTYNITGWNVPTTQNFTSRFEEGKIADIDGMYYYEREAAGVGFKEWDISLPMAMPDYIAINNAPQYNPPFASGKYDHFVDTWDRSIVNVCKSDPDLITYTDFYDFKNTNFYPISGYIKIQDFLSVPTHELFGGDCIVSRNYLKIYNASNENLGSNFIDILAGVATGSTAPLIIYYPAEDNLESAQDDFKKGYGHWVSIVSEQKHNANYRTELGRNYFYPSTNPQEPGKDFAWLYDSPESYFYNFCYSELLGPRGKTGIDLFQPVSDNKFPTRIRPSFTHIFGAVRDGYRQFTPADAKDFDYSNGEIQAIEVLFDMLYSFQNRSINLHPVNERITQQGTQGSTAILGQSTGLTQFRQIVKQGYGTQHRFGVIVANQAIYCIDYNRKAIMRVAGQEVQMLDIEKSVQTWFRNIIALGSSGYSDVLDQLPNEHPCGRGIHGVYNRKYKEVVWTLSFGEEKRTIVFSEELDCFLGTHGYKPIHYAQVNEDLYSFIDKKAWLHDKTNLYDTFYGIQDIYRIKFVVAEASEVTKHYDNLVITSNNRVFSKIKYETQHQTAEQNPFQPIVEFWYAPTYRHNEWRLPIRRADNVKNSELNIYDDFGIDKTPLRGRYLIIELEYNQNKELWVREFITFYNITST